MSVSILTSLGTLVLAKKIELEEGGYTFQQYDQAGRFRFREAFPRNIWELGSLIQTLEFDPKAAIIRGQLRAGIDPNGIVRRRMYVAGNQPPYFQAREPGTPWIMLDLDRLPLPDSMDPTRNPEEVVRRAISHLPPEFKDKTCFWQFSSSAGFKPGIIKLHLFYWLATPIQDEALRTWVKHVNQQAGQNIIDPALFNPVQLHYTARPVLGTGVIDPLPRRSGFLIGTGDTVDLDLSDVQLQASQAGTGRGTGTGSIPSSESVEFYLSCIGDHEGGLGFHEPIRNAIFAAVREGRDDGGTADWDAFKALVREAIQKADRHAHSQDEIERYLSDTYLDESVRGAEQKAGPTRKPIPGIPAHFPANEVTLEEGERLLTEAIDDKVTGAVRRKIEGDMSRPPHSGVRAQAGLGKTWAVIQRLAMPDVQEACMQVEVYVPDHQLAEEFITNLREVAPGLDVQHFKGRSQQGMCQFPEQAQIIGEAGFNVTDSLCSFCPARPTCPYLLQYQAQPMDQARVRVFTHSHLFLNRHEALPKPDLVIIDETFVLKSVTALSIPFDILVGPSARPLRWEQIDLRNQLGAILETGGSLLSELRGQGITPAQLRLAAKNEWERSPPLRLTPHMCTDDLKDAVSRFSKSRPKGVRELWSTLSKELKTQRDVSLAVRLVHWDGGVLGIEVGMRRELQSALKGAPLLLIDADLDPDLNRLLLPRLEVSEISVPRKAEVIQMSSHTGSKQFFLEPADGSFGKLDQAKKILRTERDRDGGRNVLVVTNLDIRKELCPDQDHKAAPASDFEGIKVAHFNAIRGRDIFKDCDTLIILGRNQPPPKAVEDIARALYAPEDVDLNLNGQYVPEPRGYRIRSGHLIGVNVTIHPDPRIQRVLELMRERESGQAVDRLRSVRLAGKRIVTLSNVVLDLTVDQLMHWGDFLGEPDRLGSMVEVGIILQAPKHIVSAFPNLFASENAARNWFRKGGGFPILITHRKPTPLLPLRYRVKGQRGSLAKALADPGRDNLRERLEDLIGKEVTELTSPTIAEIAEEAVLPALDYRTLTRGTRWDSAGGRVAWLVAGSDGVILLGENDEKPEPDWKGDGNEDA